MILVDTSVWVDHLRSPYSSLTTLLHAGQILAHPFVIGEIALGSLRGRSNVLHSFNRLPIATLASPDEVLHLIDRYSLFGRGIGYVDAHLLAAARLTPGTSLWTRDRRLLAAAIGIDIPIWSTPAA